MPPMYYPKPYPRKMKKTCLLLFSLLFATLSAHAQRFIAEENDTDLKVEYRDGSEWGKLDVNGLNIGIGTHVLKTDYGKFYMMTISICNDTHHPYTFDPLTVRAFVERGSNEKAKTKETAVLSAEKVQKKIREEQIASGILFGLAAGSNPAIMNMMPGFKDDYRTHIVGYLKKNTVNPGETVCGYLYITYAKGDRMKAVIPFAGKNCTFVWDVTKSALNAEYF